MNHLSYLHYCAKAISGEFDRTTRIAGLRSAFGKRGPRLHLSRLDRLLVKLEVWKAFHDGASTAALAEQWSRSIDWVEYQVQEASQLLARLTVLESNRPGHTELLTFRQMCESYGFERRQLTLEARLYEY